MYSSQQIDSHKPLCYNAFTGRAGAVGRRHLFPVDASPDNCVSFDDFVAQIIGEPLCRIITQPDQEISTLR